MKSNIIFGTKARATAPKFFTKKTPKKSDPKPRKKRSDAKHDIKFKLSPGDKKTLQLVAMDHGMSLTAFASHIVKMDLSRSKDYGFYHYDHSGQFVHVVLESDFFKVVQTLHINWQIPMRHVVHRIVKSYIDRTTGGPQIHYYNDRS